MNEHDISDTILAKSDQLNAVDLPPQSITVEVTGVKVIQKSDQPVNIELVGHEGRPYKPCLSMRRVLAQVWGTDSSQWLGRSMTLYCDNSVTWAGKEVGGIRISHLSHIDVKASVPIAKSQRVRELYTVEPLIVEQKTDWGVIEKDIIEGVSMSKTDDDLDCVIEEMKKYPEMPRLNKSNIAKAGKAKRDQLKQAA